MNYTAIKRTIGMLLITLQLSGCFMGDDVETDTGSSSPPPPPPPVGNTAPSIGGQPPATVTANDAYDFTPVASDPDGDQLNFMITNQPTWAVFNTSSGRLFGTPLDVNIGMHGDITIRVTDGQLITDMPEFSIEVLDENEPPPPPNANYVGFGSVTSGAESCPTPHELYQVTSLSGGSGAGTFRDAVSQGCRHIVFTVGGTIDLGSGGDLQISESHLTIDGSTAPSPGITLDNVLRIAIEARNSTAVHDIIVNNIRAIGGGGDVETNDLWELDGSSGAPIYNIVLDHLTMRAASDGAVDIYGDVHDVTLSHSIIMDTIKAQHYSQSSALRERITIYKNVYARNNERQPRIRYNTRQVDFVGNVIYGWGWMNNGAAGMNPEVGGSQFTPSVNVESNVYHHVSGLSGGADDALLIEGALDGSWHYSGNSWPSGESQGDGASTSGRIGMMSQGTDFMVARETSDVVTAGTHFPTAAESSLLSEIASAIGSTTPPPGGGPPPPAQCADTLDNDNDGLVDLADPGCADASDDNEMDDPPPPPPPPPGGGGTYRGVPDPTPILGFDPDGSYSIDQTSTSCSLSGNGTASDPHVIDFGNATVNCGNAGMSLSGSYVILQNGTVNVTDEDGIDAFNCSNCVIRDFNVYGTQVNLGHGSVLSFGSPFVWLRGEVAYFGDTSYNAAENDLHGLKSFGPDHWVLDAHWHHLSGDSVQAGDASRGRALRVYVGGGLFHDNGENCLDVKNSDFVVMSGFTCHTQLDGDEPGVVIHDDARDVDMFDSVIYNVNWAVVISGEQRVTLNGNDLTANNVGIEVRGANVNITGNTINAPTCIDVQGGVTGTVQSGCN